MRTALIVAFGAGLSACTLEIPPSPDLSDLASEYEHPDGVLNEDNIESIADAARAALERVEHLSSLDFVVETLDQVSEQVQEFSRATSESRFKVDLWSETRAPCPGASGDGESSEEAGMFVVSLAVEASRIRPTIWGEFAACRLERAGVTAELDATLEVFLDGDYELHSLEFESYLFRIAGDIQIGGAATEGSLDFRILREQAIEVRVPSEVGHVVVRFARGEDQEAALRTGDGTFCCHFDDRRCASVSGDSCSSSEDGDRVVRW